jgi:outer membrane protein assembly factor BamB
MTRCLGALAALAVVSACLYADWPQWRGPTRDGVAANAKLPTMWPAKPPQPLWRVPIGPGYSSPVIADGRLFIMGREEKDDLETCLCFDAATGKPLWRVAYAAPHEPHPAARSAGKGPKATPTVATDRVFFHGINGMFHCLEARTGNAIWKQDFAALYWGVEKDKDGYDTWPTYCGAAASPLVDGDRVILPVGGKKAGAITAFDRNTGKILWRSLQDRSSYASPIRAELTGIEQIVAFTGQRMAGFVPDNGYPIWEHPYKISYEQTIVSPVHWKDMILVCGTGKPTTALRMENKEGSRSLGVAWQNKDLRSYMSTPVVFKDHLLGLDDSGQLVCIELASGKTAWRGGNLGKYASFVVAGEQILALNEDGELTVLEANPAAMKVKATWTLSEAGGTWAHLAVVGNRLYVKDKTHLMCLEVPVP